MPYTTSVHIGPYINKAEELNLNGYRDNRENIDYTRTADNIVLANNWDFSKTERENLREILSGAVLSDGRSVSQVLEDYNSTKKKSRDKKTIEDLLDKKVIKREKGQAPTQQNAIRQQSMIVQVGGKENGQIDPETAKDILLAYFVVFQSLTQGKLHITTAVLHMDEETPHLHIDYVPLMLSPEVKRGVPLESSPHNIYESMLSPEQQLAVEKTKDKRAQQALTFSAVNAYFNEPLQDICEDRGIEILNPHTPPREHQDQREWRAEQKLRGIVRDFYNDKDKELHEQERELVRATKTAVAKLKDKQQELDKRESRLNDREQDFHLEWEIQQEQLKEGSERLRKERESLKKDKQDLDRQKLELQSAYVFNDLFFKQFEGDLLICPDSATTIQDVLNTIQDTRDSLEGLLTIQPNLLQALPEHLQQHCEQIIEQQQEREEQQPELEHSLGDFF